MAIYYEFDVANPQYVSRSYRLLSNQSFPSPLGTVIYISCDDLDAGDQKNFFIEVVGYEHDTDMNRKLLKDGQVRYSLRDFVVKMQHTDLDDLFITSHPDAIEEALLRAGWERVL